MFIERPFRLKLTVVNVYLLSSLVTFLNAVTKLLSGVIVIKPKEKGQVNFD